MSEKLVEVQHLQQYFPAGGMGKNKKYVQAVDDVSFAINKGETLGLVGESGCGKTTITKLVNGLIPAFTEDCTLTGQVLLHGAPVREQPLYQLARHCLSTRNI